MADYLGLVQCLIAAAAALIALLGGVAIFQRRTDGAGKLMGWSALCVLAAALLRLLPGALSYLMQRDAGALAPIGQMLAALATTVLCILLSLLWEKLYERKNSYYAEMLVRDLAGIRALACVAPVFFLASAMMQGESWQAQMGEAQLVFSAVRGGMLLVIAAVVALHYRKTRGEAPSLRAVWLLLLLAALFEAGADVGAVFVPVLETLIIPQLICLLGITALFVRYAGESAADVT